MTVAWFNCEVGVAGDMVLGALVDAGANPDDIAAAIAGLGIDGVAVRFEGVERASLRATSAHVVVDGGGAAQPHRTIAPILDALASAELPERVRGRAAAVFTELGGAEGAVHGIDPSDVELHEVGSLDAIADVVGVCAALESLDVDEVHASAIGLGHGTAATAHGVIPHPAPAVTRMLAKHNAPVVPVATSLETATPTGVALMVTLASSFGPPPEMAVSSTGMGAGTADPADRPNVVGVLVGDRAGASGPSGATAQGTACQIETNVDDVSGEVLADTIAELMTQGALDAWATPIVMKKGRPAHTVSVLALSRDACRLRDVLVRCTGTLGTRMQVVTRQPVSYEGDVVTIEGLEVRVKRAGGRIKVEHDDARAVSTQLGIPLREVLRRAESTASGDSLGGISRDS